jgi:hypothetical protein
VTHTRASVSVATAVLALTVASGAAAQGRPQGHGQPATLRVVVKDQTGGVIPGAQVRVIRTDGPDASGGTREAASDNVGVAAVQGLAPGRYAVEVNFPGFADLRLGDVRVRAGDNRREVTLALRKLDEHVAVGRDPATSASDPNSARLGNFLTREQIEALPDDPEEMERVLQEMAGPGGTIRVDGFRGGPLPPKSQIQSIRFSTGMFAAENHGGGMTFVDIATQPGIGPFRGSVDSTFRHGALNARNAFQQEKGPERTQQYTVNASGTLVKDRTSFSLSAGGASLFDSANIFAALGDGGTTTGYVRRPSDRVSVNARMDHALTRSHALRGTFQQNTNDQHNLGVGGFDLQERAFRRSVSDRTLRLSESGPWRRAWFGETRLQVRWTDSETAASVDRPAVRVLDAFTAGGAQQAGGRRTTEIEWATNVDWARGRHSVRMGALVEGGRFRSDTRTNDLGTFTFASLADYGAGRPSTYTRRTGDPLVEYSHWQTGLFLQDDWRARKDLTLSAGIRQEFQTHLDDRLNLAPRAGLTWSPFRHGRTTVRAGGGTFYDWLESEVYEQTLRVDGVRQQELIVRSPGYPDPFDTGLGQVLPASRYLLAESLVMPTRNMVSVGVSQQFRPIVGVNLNVIAMRGTNRLRGRNVNAPRDGVRPDASLGNITQVESTAGMRSRQIVAGVNYNVPARRIFLFANYAFVDQESDSDGPFSLPADSYDLAAEWGPSAGLPRHTVSAVLNTPIGSRLRLGLTTTARSGTRYNITTGRDDNGDTLFNDRPAGVGRNSAAGRGMWDVAARLSYAFGFGERAASGPAGTPAMIVQRIGAGTAGDLLGGFMPGGGAENKRIRIELFVSAQNLLNRVTPVGYSGVMTSPFFGRPTAAMPGRRIDIGARVGF